MLNDADIRPSFIDFLSSKAVEPRKIIEELHVHRGNAIADVVSIHSEAHCYEIKGDNDQINRILKQGPFYNKVFSKITLVTTEKKVKEALDKAPSFWGIIVAYRKEDKVKFRYVRKAVTNSNVNKELALSTLWKSEMTNLNCEHQLNIPEKIGKREFASQLASRLSKLQINRSIANLLATREYSIYE